MARVILYTLPTCPGCVQIKHFLRQKGVEFEEYDISKNEEARKEMIKKTGQKGVPVIEVDGTIIVGFQEEILEQALEKFGLS
jgi:glutaredoxin-like YruB-family protein